MARWPIRRAAPREERRAAAGAPGRSRARSRASIDGRLTLALLIGLALVLRVGFIVSEPQFRPYADAGAFDHVAISLDRHGVYPPSAIAPSGGPAGFRPPAYPHLLAATYALTDTTTSTDRYTVARILSALLSTLAVMLTGLIAWLLWDLTAALAAVVLAAMYPPLITVGDAMLSEPLFIPLVLGAVTCALMARRSDRRLAWTLLAGALIGAASLSRTNGIVIAPVIAAGLWFSPRLKWRSLGMVGALVATILLVIAPWAVRNYRAFHEFVPLTTQAGLTLAGTYNDVSRNDHGSPASWRVPTMAPYDRLLQSGGNEAALDRKFGSQALHYAWHNPRYVAKVAYFNLGRLLGLQGAATEHPAARETGVSTAVSDLDVYSFYLLGILAIWAVMTGGLRGIPTFVWLVPIAMAISLVFVIAYMRYRLPIDPFLILLGAGASTRGWRAKSDANPRGETT